MGDIRINLTNAVTVGLIAFVGIFVINKALDASGQSRFKIGG